ncbi:MAG: mechanosensitive ion channel family protein [Saprospiraceae bacterium]|nr:mechanosensitive ion channel family protein [Saprospiraceae bacterium]
MFQKTHIILFICLFTTVITNAQDEKIPTGNLATPQEAVLQQIYYLQEEHYDLEKSASAIVGKGNEVTEESKDITIKLKQILDGKGLFLRIDLIPDDPDYIDSTSGNPVYVPFPKEMPHIYLVRPSIGKDKRNKAFENYWRYSPESINMIPRIHKEVYPLGSHLLLELLPKGGLKILGLKSWQYLAILVLLGIAVLFHLIIWRLLSIIFKILAKTKLGKDHFDPKVIEKIARIISYMVVAYIILIFVPVLMLPVGFSYYLLAGIRVFNTIFSVLLLLNCVELARSYFEKIVENTESKSDDQLLPIFIRILKTFVVIGGAIHILDVFEVDLTALIAGLSIGGLALALAAQDTVKNLIGSVMIYADRPFQIGDFISCGEIIGTVEDIGFRSTRVRTSDSSLISVPNGSLVDMTVNNMGSLQFRRFNTLIGLAYYTPPALIEKFIAGLKQINIEHPMTMNDRNHIYLNNMGASSLDVMFLVYFNTIDYAENLKIKEELIFSILGLAEALNVHIAFPSTSVYVESVPEKKGQMPDYTDEELKEAEQKMTKFLSELKSKDQK